MKKFITLLIVAAFAAENPAVVLAAQNATLKSVRVSADSVYITTDRPVKYRSFEVANPPKLVVELDETSLRALTDIPASGSYVRKVRTGQFQTSPVSVSRVVMELSRKAAYEIMQKGTELIVVVGGRIAEGAQAVKDAPAMPEPEITVITPEPAAPAEKPSSELKVSVSAPVVVKPTDRETAPAVTRKAAAAGYSRNIVENLPRDPVSFDYSDADIREVINMLAAKAGINIIYGDDVTGQLTISLNKVPFNEAFSTILSVRNLATQQVGDNILRIASPQTFMAEQKKAMAQTRVFFLNYTKAADVKNQLDSVTAAEGRKGVATVDEANNAIIVTDTPMGLETASRLIRSLDRVPKQVLIEAKLVEVSLDSDFHMGIQWSGYGTAGDGGYMGVGDASKPLGATAKLGDPSAVVNNFASAVAGTPGPANASDGGTGVNLPANVIYGAFRLGRVASNYMFDAIISAAAKKGKAKVLSDPKVATLNNKEANINITTQIPYTTTETTASTPPTSTTKVTYLTTGIILKVTPTINSDGRISMKIAPSVSQPSASIPAVAGGAPGIDTRSADTNVIVRNGETIVIGGLIHDTQSEAVFKVPILGDIPLLGYLFKKKSVTRTRMELLIFVTPKILED